MLVSIPNGLPRPFSQRERFTNAYRSALFQSPTGSPGHLAGQEADTGVCHCIVSIPNGLPRPFSQKELNTQQLKSLLFQSPTGSPGHLAFQFPMLSDYYTSFQSPTGSPGHLAQIDLAEKLRNPYVSIPNGLPRPFSLKIARMLLASPNGFNPQRAPQAI